MVGRSRIKVMFLILLGGGMPRRCFLRRVRVRSRPQESGEESAIDCLGAGVHLRLVGVLPPEVAGDLLWRPRT